MTLFVWALGIWIVGVAFGKIKPSVNDDEFVVTRKR